MTNAAIRQQLHQYIDIADIDKVKAIYDMFSADSKSAKFSDADLAEFNNRSEQYKTGEMPSFTMEDAHAYIRAHNAKK